MILNIVVASDKEQHKEVVSQIFEEVRKSHLTDKEITAQVTLSMEFNKPSCYAETLQSTPKIYFYFDESTQWDKAQLLWISALCEKKLAECESANEFFTKPINGEILELFEKYVQTAANGITANKELKEIIHGVEKKPVYSGDNPVHLGNKPIGFFNPEPKELSLYEIQILHKKDRAKKALLVGGCALLLSIPVGFLTVAGAVLLAVLATLCVAVFLIEIYQIAQLQLENKNETNISPQHP